MYNEYNMPNGITEAEDSKLQKTETGQKITTEPGEFKPTRKMIRWLNTTQELGFTALITDISKKSKISRNRWYEWNRNDAFLIWWDAQWQRNLRQNRWKLDEIGMKQAKNRYNYWRDMMNRAGNTIPEAGTQTQVNTQINFPNANMERITR